MTLPDGWSDGELHALLQLLRKHMTLFIYATDETFARSIQRHLPGGEQLQTREGGKLNTEQNLMWFGLPGKSVQPIKEAVRELMSGLSFAMKTRKFTNEVILVDGVYVYPYEHLYETMVAQPENRQGGVWDPDELRTGIRKMETCRHFFDENPERFFTRATIWSKTVPDVRTKFYLWREIYVEESQASEDVPRLDGDLERLECLGKIFEGVPPAPSPLPPTPSPVASTTTAGAAMASPTRVRVAASTGKPPKSRFWTPEDLEAFVQLLAEITVDLQTKGMSPLVNEMGARLNRTEPSLIGKFQDIRARYEKRTPYYRAAEIPSIIYDETSVAHKIFTADWSDRDDPYSLVFFALKDLQNRAISRSKNMRPPPLQMEMRQRASSALASPGSPTASTTTTPTTTQRTKAQIHPVAKTTQASTSISKNGKPPRVPTASSSSPSSPPPPSLVAPAYSEFVRECAAMIKWDELLTYNLCVAIKTALAVYTTNPRKVFCEDVARAMGGAVDTQLVYFRGERILRLCERRYGSLDCFAAAVEGNGESSDAPVLSSSTETELKRPSPEKTPAGEDPSPAMESPRAPSVASPSASLSAWPSPSPSVLNPERREEASAASQPSKPGSRETVQSFGNSNQTAKHILQHKGTSTPANRTESSPSVHHHHPDHDAFDYDGGEHGDVGNTPQHKQRDGDNQDDEEVDTNDHGAETEVDLEDDNDVATQSLASSDFTSDVSSDFGGHDDHVAVRRQEHHHSYHNHHQRYHHSHHSHASAPGKVHVSSRKTLVVERAPQPCFCDDCRRHHGRRRHETTAMTAIHRKRSRSELYTEATGRWVEDHHHHLVHEIARRHFHTGTYESPQHDKHDDAAACNADPREIMSDHEMAEMDAMWKTLMAPIEQGIAGLEAKRREQRERAMDREKQAREHHWKKELRQQVRDEWAVMKDTTAASSTRGHTAGR